jgi:hypothetical protein
MIFDGHCQLRLVQKDDVSRHQTEKMGDGRSSGMDRCDVSEILEKHKIK